HSFLVVEMNAGQMLHDIRAAVGRHFPVHFYGRMGGAVPLPAEVEQEARAILEGAATPQHTVLEGSNGNR
ncbi:MAG: 3-methyl-2-oxobutanoate dehydrogenase subunit beta, partial [Anaerolineae bacterium]|nr:3-methyl-2-oxobutanoate dehydrogenase subunit beta [Anaerolineae bacterium]